jgi:nitrogen fixation NifU-like protein
MVNLNEIYQEIILDHYRKPRNYAELPGANRRASGHNPLCGDKVTVYLQVEDGVVKDVTFQGAGCAISTASASLMTETIKGKSVEEADAVFRRFHDMVTVGEGAGEGDLGKLEALAGVRQIPIRVKCATLVWHTMKAALLSEQEIAEAVSTE